MPSFTPLDQSPVPAASAEEPPRQDDWPGGLAPLRAELDRIDDELHGLLMKRASVVEQVAKAGKRGAYRPGREAAIIRRLLRRHSGSLPPQTLVRIWRELLAGTTAMQERFSVAVCELDGGTGFTQASREHFGALTPLRAYGSAAEALAEVGRGEASAAVLPIPSETGSAHRAWWIALLQREEPRLHVVARLPFWAVRPEGAPHSQALVITAVAPDASGRDRSLLCIEADLETGRPRLVAALIAAGLAPQTIILRRDEDASIVRALVEVEGFLTDDDPRLAGLDAALRRPVVLGAYALPEPGGAV